MDGYSTHVNLLSKNSYVTLQINLERYFFVSEVTDVIYFKSSVGTRTALTVWIV